MENIIAIIWIVAIVVVVFNVVVAIVNYFKNKNVKKG